MTMTQDEILAHAQTAARDAWDMATLHLDEEVEYPEDATDEEVGKIDHFALLMLARLALHNAIPATLTELTD